MSREEFEQLVDDRSSRDYVLSDEASRKLMAEFDRLTAEVEQLRKERDAYSERLQEVRAENADLQAEVERLSTIKLPPGWVAIDDKHIVRKELTTDLKDNIA